MRPAPKPGIKSRLRDTVPGGKTVPRLCENPGSSPPAPMAADPVPSPCISVCRMSPRTGLCEGCLRTIDEIAHWSLFDDDEKRVVLAQLAARRAAA